MPEYRDDAYWGLCEMHARLDDPDAFESGDAANGEPTSSPDRALGPERAT